MDSRHPLADLWLLYALVVRTPSLELRYPSDEDLAVLATIPSEGIHAPDRQPFRLAWTEVASPQREQESLQWWWSKRASWSVDDWWLSLAAVVDGEPVGVHDLGAKHFTTL